MATLPCFACAAHEAGRKQPPHVDAVVLNILAQVEANGFEKVMTSLCRNHTGQFNTYADLIRQARDNGSVILVGDTKH